MTEIISSARLDLIPMTPDFLRASLAGNVRQAEQIIGLSLPEHWSDAPSFLSLRLKQLEDDPSLQPWLVRAMGLRHCGAMVGHIGFHTGPAPVYLEPISPGGIEFGFTVFSAFRRQGYAEEASRALMQWAVANHCVTKFVVSIRPDNLPSQALAAKLGFVGIGSHIDEVDGPEDILQLIAAASRRAS